MQYSLRSLIVLTSCLSLLAGLTAWLGTLGFLIAIGLLGLLLCASGLVRKVTIQSWFGFGLTAFVAAILYVDMSGTVVWDGEFTLDFNVTVTNADGKAPEYGASLTVCAGWWEMETYPLDSQGRSKFSHRFPCGGHDSALGITQSSWNEIPLDEYRLLVRTIDGHEEFFSLHEVVGKSALPMGDSALPPVILVLAREKHPAPTAN